MSDLIEGVAVKLGGREYIVPALSLGFIRRNWDLLNSIDELTGIEAIEAVTVIAHAALSRNYPELKRDAVEEMLDARSIPLLMAAIKEASGFVAGEVPGAPTP